MNRCDRRLGLEQEFFLVDREGGLSHRADEVLQQCWNIAPKQGLSPNCVTLEFVKSMVEIKTSPVHSLVELTTQYLHVLKIALQAAQSLNLRLYPLSTYPLHIAPVMRDYLGNHIQARTIGFPQFENAAKCTGTHLHIELPPEVVDRRVVVSYDSTPAARAELLNLHNLATALDPVLITLSRACPFYEGQVTGLAMRTVHYRGREDYGWQGVYNRVQEVGGLMPYFDCIEDVVEHYFQRYYAWLEAMDRAGIERQMFHQTGGALLTAGWNPVRLNQLGTLELRSMDSNYPAIILALVTLVVNAVDRVRQEHLTVRPQIGLKTFEVSGDRLWLPAFQLLNGELLYAAVTEGISNPTIRAYVDSVLTFALGRAEASPALAQLKTALGDYHTTETQILNKYASPTDHLSPEEGLHLVRDCCSQLETQVNLLIKAPLQAV